MGSKNCPETPRQKLISMMYLVLTALLALNVSADILNAFIIVNESMEETNRIFVQKVESNYAAFEKAMAENPDKTKDYFDRAMKMKKLAGDLVEYIENVKAEVISTVEGISMEEARNASMKDIQQKSNYSGPTNFFIGQSHDGSTGRANDLKNEIIKFKSSAIELLDERDRALVNIGLNVEGNEFQDLGGTFMNWEMYTFYYQILAATVTLLNKTIAEVRTAENDLVAQLYSSVDAGDFKFNKISAKVIPNSRFVIQGEEYSAEIFVGAFDTIVSPEVVIGSQTIEGEGGLVTYSVRAGSVGLQKYEGVIRVKNPLGGVQEYPFEEEYIVAAPTATVSADAMNVFYIGVDNPVSISVPGVANENVQPSISNGRMIPKGGGKYTVKVESGNEARINVSAKMGEQSRSMGSFPFRVKRVPDPVPYIAGVREGNVPRGNIAANPVIIPVLENFEFDLNFIVVSFSFVMSMPGNELVEITSNGNLLTAEMIALVNGARRGSRCYIENIRARGPDGSARPIGTIPLRIM